MLFLVPKSQPSAGAHSENGLKLRGLNLPGMGCFDGAGPKARSRYTKKPPGAEEELLLSSMAVQTDKVVGNKTHRVVAGKKDGGATAQKLTQTARNQEVVKTKFGKRADWRVTKVPRKQRKSDLQKLRERLDRLENKNAEEKIGGQAAEEA